MKIGRIGLNEAPTRVAVRNASCDVPQLLSAASNAKTKRLSTFCCAVDIDTAGHKGQSALRAFHLEMRVAAR